MKRKKSSGGGGANWMDTYGDMVTLLLCFFVLLYSMSSISEENWRALVMMFNPDAVQVQTETPGGDGPDSASDNAGVMPEGDLQKEQEEINAMIEQLYQTLTEYVQEEGMQDTISVTKGDGKIFVTFNQTVFFDADSSVLREDAYPVLDSVCGMLDDAVSAIDEVRVLGHTAQASQERDNFVEKDRMLSSERATNVVIYVQKHSLLDPGRLISEGIGQWRPIADNTTEEGRARNRRVEMIISGRDLEKELQENITYYEIETETGTDTEAGAETGTDTGTSAE